MVFIFQLKNTANYFESKCMIGIFDCHNALELSTKVTYVLTNRMLLHKKKIPFLLNSQKSKKDDVTSIRLKSNNWIVKTLYGDSSRVLLP